MHRLSIYFLLMPLPHHCRAQEDGGEEAGEPVVEKMLKDEIVRLVNIKASSKIRSVPCGGGGKRNDMLSQRAFSNSSNAATSPSSHRWVDCISCAGNELKLALLLQNNTVETYSLKMSDKTPTANKTARLTLGGHRTDVRTLAFSSDNLAVLSASGDTVKVWNR